MSKIKNSSYKALVIVEDIGLLIIALATVIAIGSEVLTMFTAKAVTLADLLLLFIYLEILAMVGIYLKTGQLPVRIPLYIAIVAIARYVILDMKNLDKIQILALSGSVLIIAIAILVLRYGHIKFPYIDKKDDAI